MFELENSKLKCTTYVANTALTVLLCLEVYYPVNENSDIDFLRKPLMYYNGEISF